MDLSRHFSWPPGLLMQRGSWEEAIGVDDLEKYPAMPYLDEGYVQTIPGGSENR